MSSKTKRKCQPCTACCDGWVQMEINGVPVYPGSPCPHSTGKGCDAYDKRPKDPCDNFNCAWVMENSLLPEWMQPNNSKVLLILDKLVWNGLAVDLAVPVGRRIPPRALKWLQENSQKTMRPLLYMEQIKDKGKFQKQQNIFAYGPPEFQQQAAQLQQQGKSLW